jgi:hypothetical protein
VARRQTSCSICVTSSTPFLLLLVTWRILVLRDARASSSFTLLQAAAADVVDGDKLLLSPGTHKGPLHLTCKVRV